MSSEFFGLKLKTKSVLLTSERYLSQHWPTIRETYSNCFIENFDKARSKIL
jgi:hypothetical protein